jgi:hypothetical protein
MAQLYRPPVSTAAPNNTNPYGQYRASADDPRLSNVQRIDQQYQNFTYGADADYAQGRAKTLQDEGQANVGAAGVIQGASQQSADAARQRAAPGALTDARVTGYEQGGLYNRLLDYANAPAGPSAAQAQLQKASDQAMAANLALAGSGTGMGDSAEAMRRAQFANATQQATAANDSAVLRAQEEQQRQQNILQAYNQGAGVLSDQGQLALGASGQELQGRSLNDQTALAYDQMALDAYRTGIDADLAYEQEARANLENELEAGMGFENVKLGSAAQRNSRQLQDDQQAFDRDTQMIGAGLGVVSSLGGAAMMSDQRQKRRIRELETLNDEYAALSE